MCACVGGRVRKDGVGGRVRKGGWEGVGREDEDNRACMFTPPPRRAHTTGATLYHYSLPLLPTTTLYSPSLRSPIVDSSSATFVRVESVLLMSSSSNTMSYSCEGRKRGGKGHRIVRKHTIKYYTPYSSEGQVRAIILHTQHTHSPPPSRTPRSTRGPRTLSIGARASIAR